MSGQQGGFCFGKYLKRIPAAISWATTFFTGTLVADGKGDIVLAATCEHVITHVSVGKTG